MIQPEEHVRLVGFVARRYRNRGCPMQDLIAEGMLALVRAAENFDAQHGSRFSTYAITAIRNAMHSFLQSEIQYRKQVSLVGSGMLDCVTAPPVEVPAQLIRILSGARLSPREWEALEARFGLGTVHRTLRELATEWKVTRQRVHRVQKSALRKLQAVARDLGAPAGRPAGERGSKDDADVLVRCA
jgi:DNA-directed RNA polymerase sigma subunit (sigma70/sigma32)